MLYRIFHFGFKVSLSFFHIQILEFWGSESLTNQIFMVSTCFLSDAQDSRNRSIFNSPEICSKKWVIHQRLFSIIKLFLKGLLISFSFTEKNCRAVSLWAVLSGWWLLVERIYRTSHKRLHATYGICFPVCLMNQHFIKPSLLCNVDGNLSPEPSLNVNIYTRFGGF